jgi:hypothetical protein
MLDSSLKKWQVDSNEQIHERLSSSDEKIFENQANSSEKKV